ncbi:MAG TPA: phage portal protein [Ignavibacteria bacterium]|nr:phage portal protein [Ignavibacteria bacterium]
MKKFKLISEATRKYFRQLGGIVSGSASTGRSIGTFFGGAKNIGFDVYKGFGYACINSRAENISKAKIYLYDDKAGRNDKEILKHDFLALINKPNAKNQTFREILFRISASLDLYGNAYLYIHRGIGGKPAGIYQIPSKFVDIKLNSAGTEVESYIYYNSGKATEYPRRDIIHFLIPDPDCNYKGKPTIDGFNLTLEIDYLQNLYQRNFYKNDASPGMVIEVEREMMDTEFERFRDKFRSLYEGALNTGKALFLDSGAKAKPFQSQPKDVEILKAREWIRDEIMSIFRVPKIILGITNDVNRANAVQQLRTFNDNVIKPFAKLTIESKFNSFLQENYPDENLRLAMEYDFENDRDLQLRSYELYMKYGITTIDEIRELEGFQKLNSK